MNSTSNSKMPIRTVGIFTFILFAAVFVTWWFTRNFYDNSESNDRAFARMNMSLQNSSRFLKRDCVEDSIYIASKLLDPGIKQNAIRYKSKIDSVMLLATGMHNYIKELKLSFDLLSDYKNENEIGVNSQKNGKWKLSRKEIDVSLYDSLNSYSKALLKNLPYKIQNYNLPILIDTAQPALKNRGVWQKNYLDGLTIPALLATLSELEYQVWLSANEITNMLSTQWCDILQLDNVRYCLATQNSSYFLPGQTLEISVGLGAYVTSITPKILIGGQEYIVNAEGYTIFRKTLTNGKGGLIPIDISYKHPITGETKSMSKLLSYHVLQPSKK